MPSSAELGHDLVAEHRACRSISSRLVAQIGSSTSRGIRPLAARTATPAAIRRLRPATRTMKNSSRLLAKIARNRRPLEQRQAVVLGQLEDPLVEAQPGELAVEEDVVVLLDRREGRGVGLVGRLDVEGVGRVAERLGVTGPSSTEA